MRNKTRPERVPTTTFYSNVSLSCALLLLFLSPITSWAQAPITSSGLNTQISGPLPVGGRTQYNITGGTRPGGGANLYHSFGDFNVPTNNIANFLNSGSINPSNPNVVLPSGLPTTNILGRINGGNPSSIFGMIQTNGPGGFPNANLFLMNPNGFLFGPTATINVGGMVNFTTADYMRLTDNARFNAVAGPGDLLLTAAPVAAFGFLGNNPAAIAIQGSTLKVADGQSLSLVGGNQGFVATDPDTGNPIPVPGGITMTGGKLLAPGGQINIVSVAGPGEISAADFMPAQGMAMGNINLSQGALLDVSADAAGAVRIRGGQLVINDATISADTANSNGAPVAVDINVTGDLSLTDTRGLPGITARTTGTGDAGSVQISSGKITATTSIIDPSFTVSVIDTSTSGSGTAGNVNIVTGDIITTAQNGAQFFFIDSGTKNSGHGGNISISAADIDLTRTFFSTGDFVARYNLSDSSGVTGSAGNLTITADSLRVNLGGITTEAFASFPNDLTQKGGDVTLNVKAIDLVGAQIGMTATAGGGVLAVNADTFHMDSTFFETAAVTGSGGNVAINARTVELINASQIITTTLGDGNAGNITINATDHVSLIGGTSQNARNVEAPSGIFSNSTGELGSLGNAGNVVVNTKNLEMVGGRINTVTASSGSGGNVTIHATGSMNISGEFSGNPENVAGAIFDVGPLAPSGIVTQTIGRDFCSGPCGNAGQIFITTGSLTMGNGAQINSGTSNNGRGGDITLSVAGPVSIAGTLSDGSPVGMSSRTIGTDPGSGNGGNIELRAAQFQITNGAQISANTLGTGNAGNVILKGPASPAQSVVVDGAGSGVFTDTHGTGAGGNISIDSNSVRLQNGGTLSAATSGTAPSATGGTITVNAPNSVTMTNGAHITASSTGPGNTGDIQINAGNQFAMTNSTVTTEANQSGGGLIKITTNPNGAMQLTNSMISASVLDGNGGGGSVNIDPQYVVLQNSQILAQAVQGPGGNISITTNLLLPDSTSVISASSQFGQQGTISIQSPIAPAGGKVFPLTQKPLLATTMFNQRCAALAGGVYSSFTVAGRDSLPAEPGGWLSSPLTLGTISEVKALEAKSEQETPLLSLRQIAPPGFLTQAFAVESSGCLS